MRTYTKLGESSFNISKLFVTSFPRLWRARALPLALQVRLKFLIAAMHLDIATSFFSSTKRVNIKVGSKQTFDLARTLLKLCFESHKEYPSYECRSKPKRVVEIVGWDARWIRLYHTIYGEIKP
jgi:hypothetical protein